VVIVNPLDWLKILYEAFGAKHPITSYAVVMIVGALVFGAAWTLGARQFEKSRTEGILPTPPAVIQNSGDCSANIAGSGNKTSVDCEDKTQK
jgi:hypothetical protein